MTPLARRRSPYLVAAAAVAACFAVAPSAGASELTPSAARALGIEPSAQASYRLLGYRWGTRRIPYYNGAKRYRWSVRKAVSAWNRSGARIRFRAVSRRRAKVLIRYYPGPGGGCQGHAEANTLVGGGRARRAVILISRPNSDFPGCSRWGMANIVAHELGHVLGLNHEPRRCAVMNPEIVGLRPSRCPRAAEWRWHCRILERDDVRGAVRKYGGRVRRRGPRYCDVVGPPRPVTELRAAPGGWSDLPLIRLSFRRPQPRRLPSWLGFGPAGGEFVAAAGRGTCPGSPGATPGRSWDVAPGRLQEHTLEADQGTWCVAVWARDAVGRLSRRATATTTVDVAALPDP